MAFRTMRVDVYQDTSGGWRWRLRAANGKIVADGAEGYSAKRKCLAALERMLEWCASEELEAAFSAALFNEGR